MFFFSFLHIHILLAFVRTYIFTVSWSSSFLGLLVVCFLAVQRATTMVTLLHFFAIEDDQSSKLFERRAGAKLGTPPRVGAERLADVRN